MHPQISESKISTKENQGLPLCPAQSSPGFLNLRVKIPFLLMSFLRKFYFRQKLPVASCHPSWYRWPW